MKILIFLALVCVINIHASLIGDLTHRWNNLRGGKFLGKRYWKNNDPALILLFDKNGYIAGMQTAAPKSKFTPLPGLKGTNYIDDGDYWTLTAYFVDPSTICTTGRTKDQFKATGTGTGLWLQNGPDPLKNVVNIPVKEEDIKKTKWGYGKCTPTMGQHYWFNVTKDMSCDQFFPNCLLYNGGKLTGFCWTRDADLQSTSERYDDPPPTPDVVNKFLNPVPDCFFKTPSYARISSIHVYFLEAPLITTWC